MESRNEERHNIDRECAEARHENGTPAEGHELHLYTDRLKQPKMATLRYRRIRGDMIEAFKIIREIYDQIAIPTLSP